MTDPAVMRDVALIAARAIADRIGYPLPEAASVDSVPDQPRVAILNVNSGGNSLACQQVLRMEGFRVTRMSVVRHGVRLRVTDERGAS